MKTIYTLLFFVLLLGLHAKGQGASAALKASWKDLVAQLQRRNDVATVLLLQLKETHQLDSSVLQKTKGTLTDFTHYLRKQLTGLDSSTVKRVYEMNRAASAQMGRALVLLEIHPRIRQTGEIAALLQHLEGTETRIQSLKQQHNKLALAHGRPDLAFGEQ